MCRRPHLREAVVYCFVGKCFKSLHIPSIWDDSYGSVSAVSSSGPWAHVISLLTRQREYKDFVVISEGSRGQSELSTQ